MGLRFNQGHPSVEFMHTIIVENDVKNQLFVSLKMQALQNDTNIHNNGIKQKMSVTFIQFTFVRTWPPPVYRIVSCTVMFMQELSTPSSLSSTFHSTLSVIAQPECHQESDCTCNSILPPRSGRLSNHPTWPRL